MFIYLAMILCNRYSPFLDSPCNITLFFRDASERSEDNVQAPPGLTLGVIYRHPKKEN